MVASYAIDGDSFRPDKPRLWSDRRYVPRPGQRSWNLHPDGERVVLNPAPEEMAAAKQDRVVFIFNFFDELRRSAPSTKR
jgi:hypothetical protein